MSGHRLSHDEALTLLRRHRDWGALGQLIFWAVVCPAHA